MKNFRTHYDNLKISRDAPDYVIRAAYKSLVQKYHPDKNPGNSRANKILSIINDSYKVLSDPITRKQHDEWILRKEQEFDSKKSNSADNSRQNNSNNHQKSADSKSSGMGPDNTSKKNSEPKSWTNETFAKYLKQFILLLILFLIIKYFGSIIGLTATLSYLTWTKISPSNLLVKYLATIGVLALGIILWFYAATSYVELMNGVRKVNYIQGKNNDPNINPPEVKSKPVNSLNLNPKPEDKNPENTPIWIRAEKEEIQTSIGLFSVFSMNDWDMGVLLNNKQVLADTISDGGGRVTIDAAIDFGGSAVLLFKTFNGGNCFSGCQFSYAASFNHSGQKISIIQIPSDFDDFKHWKEMNGAYYSEPMPLNGRLYTATISRNGVSSAPRKLHMNDETPDQLCTSIFELTSDSCSRVSKLDCEKINSSKADELWTLDSRNLNEYAIDYGFSRLLVEGENDPRFNFTEFKNICYDYCIGSLVTQTKHDFSKKVCNSK